MKTSLRVLFAAYILGLVGFSAIFYKTLFSWPAGIVTGNLLASAIWAPLAVIHLDRLGPQEPPRAHGPAAPSPPGTARCHQSDRCAAGRFAGPMIRP